MQRLQQIFSLNSKSIHDHFSSSHFIFFLFNDTCNVCLKCIFETKQDKKKVAFLFQWICCICNPEPESLFFSFLFLDEWTLFSFLSFTYFLPIFTHGFFINFLFRFLYFSFCVCHPRALLNEKKRKKKMKNYDWIQK